MPTCSRTLIDDSLPSEFLSILSEFHPSLFSTCRLPKAGQVPSKTLSTLRTELGRLRTGTFLHSHQWDNDWMKTNANRFSEHGTTSWEEVGTMVRTSIEHLQEAIKLGMSWTPCSPAQFIVNAKEPGKCRSAFLTFLTQKPKSQAGRIDEAVAISIPEKTKNRIKNWYETLDPSARLPMVWVEKDWQKVWYSVKELKDWFTKNTDAMDSANDDGQWGYRLGSFGNFLTAVLDFLSGGGAGQQITPRLIPLEGWKWDAFVKHLLTDYDVKMARGLK